ncbi:MAG: ribose 5-phosphate isomerase B [Bacteroidota bacterium]
MTNNTIAIGSDHAGFACKQTIINWLTTEGYPVTDVGAYNTESVDYPDFAHPVASAVESGAAVTGILICGSGNGVCITANKHSGVRAALCWNDELAALARQHNDANVLCIPARFVEEAIALSMTRTFLNTAFEGGRHVRRVEKIAGTK